MSVQSVLDGYNGTVMAYGQTGTGKTYTLGSLGKDDDASQRGIMVRALEQILAATSSSDTVQVSYLQVSIVSRLFSFKRINRDVEEHMNLYEYFLQ